eukprot:m.367006 g.367006  ORF g.367006 m.367006 type:complete len:60 (+) comp28097_c0_seq12:174-353(+)
MNNRAIHFDCIGTHNQFADAFNNSFASSGSTSYDTTTTMLQCYKPSIVNMSTFWIHVTD